MDETIPTNADAQAFGAQSSCAALDWLRSLRGCGRGTADMLGEALSRFDFGASVAELADAMGCTVRTIYRAKSDLEYTHRGRLISQPIEYGRRGVIVGHRRRLVKELSSPHDRSRIHQLDAVDGSDLGPIIVPAILDQAEHTRPQTAAPISPPIPQTARRKLINLRLPDHMRHPPYLRLEDGILAAIVHQHGVEGLAEVQAVLRERLTRQHPAEAKRAAVVLLEREARTSVGGLYRTLFRVECNRTAEAKIRPPDKALFERGSFSARAGPDPPPGAGRTRDRSDDWVVDADYFERLEAESRSKHDPDAWMHNVGRDLDNGEIPY